MTKRDGNCTRCQGRGRGPWAQEMGKCYGCQGAGTYEAQARIRAAAKALNQRIAEREEVSILIAAPTARAASEAYQEAMRGPDRDTWAGGPIWAEIAPGWFAGTETMHLATTLEWLAK